jgi:hypothetical protein
MVRLHIRRADSGNIDRYTRRAMKKMGVACSFKYKCEESWRKTAWKVLYLSNS